MKFFSALALTGVIGAPLVAGEKEAPIQEAPIKDCPKPHQVHRTAGVVGCLPEAGSDGCINWRGCPVISFRGTKPFNVWQPASSGGYCPPKWGFSNEGFWGCNGIDQSTRGNIEFAIGLQCLKLGECEVFFKENEVVGFSHVMQANMNRAKDVKEKMEVYRGAKTNHYNAVPVGPVTKPVFDVLALSSDAPPNDIKPASAAPNCPEKQNEATSRGIYCKEGHQTCGKFEGCNVLFVDGKRATGTRALDIEAGKCLPGRSFTADGFMSCDKGYQSNHMGFPFVEKPTCSPFGNCSYFHNGDVLVSVSQDLQLLLPELAKSKDTSRATSDSYIVQDTKQKTSKLIQAFYPASSQQVQQVSQSRPGCPPPKSITNEKHIVCASECGLEESCEEAPNAKGACGIYNQCPVLRHKDTYYVAPANKTIEDSKDCPGIGLFTQEMYMGCELLDNKFARAYAPPCKKYGICNYVPGEGDKPKNFTMASLKHTLIYSNQTTVDNSTAGASLKPTPSNVPTDVNKSQTQTPVVLPGQVADPAAKCPLPNRLDAKGRVGCTKAQKDTWCMVVDNCAVVKNNTEPLIAQTIGSQPDQAANLTCPEPNTINDKGHVGCRQGVPAKCAAVEGCLVFLDEHGKPYSNANRDQHAHGTPEPVNGASNPAANGLADIDSTKVPADIKVRKDEHNQTVIDRPAGCPGPNALSSAGLIGCSDKEPSVCHTHQNCPVIFQVDGKQPLVVQWNEAEAKQFPAAKCSDAGAKSNQGQFGCRQNLGLPCGPFQGCYVFVQPDGKPINASSPGAEAMIRAAAHKNATHPESAPAEQQQQQFIPVSLVISGCAVNPACPWRQHATTLACAQNPSCTNRTLACEEVCARNPACMQTVKQGVSVPVEACQGHEECVKAVEKVANAPHGQTAPGQTAAGQTAPGQTAPGSPQAHGQAASGSQAPKAHALSPPASSPIGQSASDARLTQPQGQAQGQKASSSAPLCQPHGLDQSASASPLSRPQRAAERPQSASSGPVGQSQGQSQPAAASPSRPQPETEGQLSPLSNRIGQPQGESQPASSSPVARPQRESERLQASPASASPRLGKALPASASGNATRPLTTGVPLPKNAGQAGKTADRNVTGAAALGSSASVGLLVLGALFPLLI